MISGHMAQICWNHLRQTLTSWSVVGQCITEQENRVQKQKHSTYKTWKTNTHPHRQINCKKKCLALAVHPVNCPPRHTVVPEGYCSLLSSGRMTCSRVPAANPKKVEQITVWSHGKSWKIRWWCVAMCYSNMVCFVHVTAHVNVWVLPMALLCHHQNRLESRMVDAISASEITIFHHFPPLKSQWPISKHRCVGWSCPPARTWHLLVEMIIFTLLRRRFFWMAKLDQGKRWKPATIQKQLSGTWICRSCSKERLVYRLQLKWR